MSERRTRHFPQDYCTMQVNYGEIKISMVEYMYFVWQELKQTKYIIRSSMSLLTIFFYLKNVFFCFIQQLLTSLAFASSYSISRHFPHEIPTHISCDLVWIATTGGKIQPSAQPFYLEAMPNMRWNSFFSIFLFPVGNLLLFWLIFNRR